MTQFILGKILNCFVFDFLLSSTEGMHFPRKLRSNILRKGSENQEKMLEVKKNWEIAHKRI